MPPRRRTNPKSFFEPMYSPSPAEPFADDSFENSDWDFTNNKGPCRFTFSAKTLEAEGLPYRKVESITFLECDFLGKFKNGIIHFHKCTFDMCDFGGSEFTNDKFTSCIFKNTSFTLTKFFNCQMRDCEFEEIGISGNETQFVSTDLTNPGALIEAATTNLKYLPDYVGAEYQKLRLELTKGTLSKVILHNLAKEGSDYSYYDALKTAQLHGTLADKAAATLSKPKYDKEGKRKSRGWIGQWFQWLSSQASYTNASTEYWLLLTVGSVNGWGRSISRTVWIGMLCTIVLSGFRYVIEPIELFGAIVQTVEVFLVFGYTKHSALSDVTLKSLLDLVTAICGLGWYAVAVATVISKITKVRG